MSKAVIDIVLEVIEEKKVIPPYYWLEACQTFHNVETEAFIQAVKQLESVHIVRLETKITGDGKEVVCYVLQNAIYTQHNANA